MATIKVYNTDTDLSNLRKKFKASVLFTDYLLSRIQYFPEKSAHYIEMSHIWHSISINLMHELINYKASNEPPF